MAERVQHLRPGDYRRVPWKNGGGATTELAIFPPNAGVATPFIWRLSVADVPGPGPFSPFSGVERIIVQLAGPPLRLAHGPHGGQLLTTHVPYRFAGEWATKAEMQGGPARDFNVMVRRGQATAHVEALILAPGQTVSRPLKDTAAVYALQDGAQVTTATGTWRLAADETLLVTGMPAVPLTLTGAPVLLVLIATTRPPTAF